MPKTRAHQKKSERPAPVRQETDLKNSVLLSDVISAMSHALDITEGQPEGHGVRSCLIAMKLAELLELADEDRSALFYGTLMKDAGCSSNAAKVCSLFGADDREVKQGLKITNWTQPGNAFQYLLRHVVPNRNSFGKIARALSLAVQPGKGKELIQTRCSRGADIARKLGFNEATSEVIRGLDEHWDGRGEPLGLKGDQIPLLARIAGLAQTVEVYHSTFGMADALEMASQRSGKWFDPELVRALLSLEFETDFWWSLNAADSRRVLSDFEPRAIQLTVDEERLDAIAEGFAEVVDAKSPWTFRHSLGVAEATVGIMDVMGYSQEKKRYWRRAALLHDIGKLGVSNLILDKPAKLTEAEFTQMKQHVDHTRRILKRVPCFAGFADDAAAHHEKLDGSGYSLAWKSDEISKEARILCVADIYDALSANRPYRERQLDTDEVITIMEKDAGRKICREAFDALLCHVYSR